MTSDPTTPSIQAVHARGRRRRSFLRGTVITLGTLCLLAGIALWISTRSWFIAAVVGPAIEDALGGEVRIGRATYHGEGRFSFHDVRLRAPEIEGTGGEISHIREAYVDVDMANLLRGRVRVHDMVFYDMVLRLSEERGKAGSFNVMALSPSKESPSEILPPRLQITKAMVEVGVHHEGDYELRGRRTLTGSLVPVTDEDGLFGFTLVEIDERGQVLPDKGIVVQGRWNPLDNRHSFRVSDVALDARTYGMCPQIARLWWERMELGGRVHSVNVQWAAEDQFKIEFEVEDVGLTLPIETTNLWAGYRGGEIVPSQGQPRMQVSSGTIRIDPDAVVMNDMQGALVSSSADENVVELPYRVTLRLHDLPKPDWDHRQQWMDEILSTAPFEAVLEMDEFHVQRIEEGRPPPVELPMAVAQLLQRFRLSDWSISSTIRVSRDAPMRSDDGELLPQPIRSRGEALLTDAAGTYERFPYPLEQIHAEIEFDHEQVVLHELRGVGSGGAVLTGDGVIAPPDMFPGVSLNLTVTDVPLDDALRGALRPGQQQVFDALLNQPAHEALKEAGALPDDSVLGGAIDLQIHIAREPGRGMPTLTTGTIDLDPSRILYERFPYPLEIGGGRILWQPDRVAVLGEGIRFTTPCGGQGTVIGEIMLPKRQGALVMEPDLHFNVDDDVICPSLLAAIPPGEVTTVAGEPGGDGIPQADETLPESDVTLPGDDSVTEAPAWPGIYSPIAAWLEEVSLAGKLDYHVHVGIDENGNAPVTFTADVALSEGTAEGFPMVAEAMGHPAGDAGGSDRWRLKECSALLRITPEKLDILQMTGRCPNGHLSVGGRATFSPIPALRIDVQMKGLPVDDHLMQLFGESVPEQVQKIWDRYVPQGSADAWLEYVRVDGRTQPPKLTLHPRTVYLRVDETPLSLRCTDGAVRIADHSVTFDDLDLELVAEDGTQGSIALSGRWHAPGPEEAAKVQVSGSWQDARLESALIPELLEAFAAPEQVEYFQSLQPRGLFEAGFSYSSSGGEDQDDGSYEVRVLPRTVGLVVRGQPMSWQLEEGAHVVFTPGRIDLGPTVARSEGGRFSLRGHVETDAPARILVHLDQEAPLTELPLQAILPEPVTEVLSALKFEEGAATAVRSGVLKMTRVASDETDDGWAVAFEGRLILHDAALKAGLDFTEATGPLDLSVTGTPGATPSVNIDVQLERARVLGQDLRNVHAHVSLSEAGDQVLLPDLRAEAGDGIVTVDASIGIGDRDDYAVSARLTGVPVSDFVIRNPEATEASAASGEAPPPAVSGQLYASIDLSGRRDQPEHRVGRGIARVLDGRLANIPLTLQLLQLLQMTIPPDGLDYADAEFYIVGDRAVFERILFEGTIGRNAALQLLGRGEMNLETFELDARFRSRSGVAIIRDIVGEISDQLAVLEVSGPLWNPHARLVPLPRFTGSGGTATSAAPLVLVEDPPVE